MFEKIKLGYYKCAKVSCAKKIKGLEAEIGKMQETLLHDAGQGFWGSLGVVMMTGLHRSLEKCENRYRKLLDKETYYRKGCLN